MLFHHDSAAAHMSLVVATKLHDLHLELLPHVLYLPDLASSNYSLFPNLKKWLAGFTSNDEAKAETATYFVELDKAYYTEGIKKLESR